MADAREWDVPRAFQPGCTSRADDGVVPRENRRDACSGGRHFGCRKLAQPRARPSHLAHIVAASRTRHCRAPMRRAERDDVGDRAGLRLAQQSTCGKPAHTVAEQNGRTAVHARQARDGGRHVPGVVVDVTQQRHEIDGVGRVSGCRYMLLHRQPYRAIAAIAMDHQHGHALAITRRCIERGARSERLQHVEHPRHGYTFAQPTCDEAGDADAVFARHGYAVPYGVVRYRGAQALQ